MNAPHFLLKYTRTEQEVKPAIKLGFNFMSLILCINFKYMWDVWMDEHE